MTNKVNTALLRTQSAMTRYTDLRVQALRDEQVLMEELAETLFRIEEIIDRMDYRLNTQATAARRARKEHHETTAGND